MSYRMIERKISRAQPQGKLITKTRVLSRFGPRKVDGLVGRVLSVRVSLRLLPSYSRGFFQRRT